VPETIPPGLPSFAMRRLTFLSLFLAAIALSGCDLFGESAEKIAAAKEAEGKAIGGACRHAGRAIEDCYALNKKADKAAVFAGWRDMNDYMRENKIDTVPSQVMAKGEAKAEPKATAKASPEAAAEAPVAEPVVEKKGAKPAKASAKSHDS
jgi:hypothetical protein